VRADGTTPHEDWFVGVPGMGRLTAPLSDGLDLRNGARVTAIEGAPRDWRLAFEDETVEGPFDAVVASAPAPQTRALLADLADGFDRLDRVRMAPSWTAMLAFDGPAAPGYAARRFEEGTLGWIADDSAKPGRPGGHRWVVQASPNWSAAHLEDAAESVADALSSAFAEATGIRLTPAHVEVHRWRYAFATEPLGAPCLADPRAGLFACGDWCIAPRVEAAFDSGRACAEAVLGRA
jgi:hypothetical protein